jgi:RNA polymerase sigma-70 factor, ECF subfamily
VESDPQQQFVKQFLASQHRVYRFILTLLPRWADAEEVFQQTSLTLWQTWDRFDSEGNFTRWACGIAMNHVRNYLRKKQNRQLALSDDLLEQIAECRLEHQSTLDDLHGALAECLEKLPSHQRQLVHGCYGEELTIKTVAERVGRTPNAVYKLLRHIRSSLFDCIARSVSWGGAE